MSEEENSNQPRKGKRIRSPAYPAIGLREAIERAKTIYEQNNRHPAPIQAISEIWGYAKDGSTGPLYAAALRRYGLLEEVITPKGLKELKLTATALKTILAPDQNDEVISLLKDAALKPKIFSELWNHYLGNLPEDKVIRYYLLSEKGFNPDSVDYFIKIFKDTIALANLASNDKIDQNDAQEDDKELENASRSMNPVVQDRKEERQSQLSSNAPGMIEIPVPLPSGALAYYRVPQKMSEDDFIFYKDLLGHYKRGLTGTDEHPAVK